MGTVHEQMADDLADDWLRDGNGQILTVVKDGLSNGRWPDDYLAAFLGGAWNGRSYGQLAAFATLDMLIFNRRLALIQVAVGTTPSRDADRAENAAALASLPAPFAADLCLTQNGADFDGTLRWGNAIDVKAFPGGDDDWFTVPTPRTTVPLEVGSCKASRILLHVWKYGAVARWPYGSTDLWIMVGLPTPIEFITQHRNDMATYLGVTTP